MRSSLVCKGRGPIQSVYAFAALKLRRTRFALRALRGCATRSPKGGVGDQPGFSVDLVPSHSEYAATSPSTLSLRSSYAGHALPFGLCAAAPRVARRAKRGGPAWI